MYVFGIRTTGVFFLFVCFQQYFSCIPTFLLEKSEIILGVIIFWHKCLCEDLTLNQSFSVCGTWCAQTRREAEEGRSLPRDCLWSTAKRRGEGKKEGKKERKSVVVETDAFFVGDATVRLWFPQCCGWVWPIFFSLLKTKGGKQSKLLCGHEFFLLMDVWGLYVVFLLTCTSIFPFNHTNIICSFSHN